MQFSLRYVVLAKSCVTSIEGTEVKLLYMQVCR